MTQIGVIVADVIYGLIEGKQNEIAKLDSQRLTNEICETAYLSRKKTLDNELANLRSIVNSGNASKIPMPAPAGICKKEESDVA